jgi:hypothetical protein
MRRHAKVLPVLLTLLGIDFSSRPAAGQSIGTEFRLTLDPNIHELNPQAAAFEKTIVAVYEKSGSRVALGSRASTDGGATWSTGSVFPRLTGSDDVYGPPSVSVDSAGEFYVAVLYSTGPKFIALYRGSPGLAGLSWQGPAIATPPLDEAEPYGAPHLAVNEITQDLYLTYIRSIQPTSTSREWVVTFVRSTNAGGTWSPPQALSGASSGSPRCVVGPEGEIYVVWVDFDSEHIVMRRSIDGGATFEPERLVAPVALNLGSGPPGFKPRANLGHPADDACGVMGFSGDGPAVAVDRTHGPRRGTLYVAWPEPASGTPGPLLFPPAGEIEPNDSFAAATEVSIGQAITCFQGSVDEPPFENDDDTFAFDATAGTTIFISGALTNTDAPGDRLACGCAYLFSADDTSDVNNPLAKVSFNRGSLPAMPPLLFTAPRTGRYFLWVPCGFQYSFQYSIELRAYQVDGQSAAMDHRDIVMVASTNQGEAWTQKRRVNDDPPHFDNSHPEIAVDSQGGVHAAWYDRSEDLAEGRSTNTHHATSRDGGQSFSPPQRLGTFATDWQPIVPTASNIGEHLVLLPLGEQLLALWTQHGRPDSDIFGTLISPVPVSVAVVTLHAEPRRTHVEFSWFLEADHTAIGFRLQRSLPDGSQVRLVGRAMIDSRGTGPYAHHDWDVVPGVSYRYTLEVLLRDGKSEWVGPVESGIQLIAAPPVASPNPFRERLFITLNEPASQAKVFNSAGRLVHDWSRSLGRHSSDELRWDGTDMAGNPVPDGVYFIRIALPSGNRTIKVLRMP